MAWKSTSPSPAHFCPMLDTSAEKQRPFFKNAVLIPNNVQKIKIFIVNDKKMKKEYVSV